MAADLGSLVSNLEEALTRVVLQTRAPSSTEVSTLQGCLQHTAKWEIFFLNPCERYNPFLFRDERLNPEVLQFRIVTLASSSLIYARFKHNSCMLYGDYRSMKRE